jgi:hypothetical protein
VTPLREGGSLPALVEADDDALYVLEFRGADQGPNALDGRAGPFAPNNVHGGRWWDAAWTPKRAAAARRDNGRSG